MAIIDKPSDYFNTKLYTGNATDNTAITGVGFSPDWVWIKNRDAADSHHLADTILGAGKRLRSDTTTAVASPADGVKSFDSDGITIGTTGSLNGSGNSIVGWFWRGSDSSAVSNTDGSITSSVSANTTSGFSIVSYTGTGSNATVGHGLGVAPKVIILKQTSGTESWVVFFPELDVTLALNSTGANNHSTKFSPFFNSTDPTSTVFSLGTDGQTNASGATYIAYCFAEKQGYSKFGSYTGNGSTDGTFIYTGMRPAFVMTKRTDTTSEWVIFDNKRDSFNQVQKFLQPDSSSAEGNDNGTSSGKQIDFLSNGWKMRGTTAGMNASGSSYIYMAFAENPFVTSTGVPATAR